MPLDLTRSWTNPDLDLYRDTVNRFITTVAGVYLFLAVAGFRTGIVTNFIVFVPYLLTGSLEIAGATLQKFKHHQVVVWEKLYYQFLKC